jgi:hypothetical protein
VRPPDDDLDPKQPPSVSFLIGSHLPHRAEWPMAAHPPDEIRPEFFHVTHTHAEGQVGKVKTQTVDTPEAGTASRNRFGVFRG